WIKRDIESRLQKSGRSRPCGFNIDWSLFQPIELKVQNYLGAAILVSLNDRIRKETGCGQRKDPNHPTFVVPAEGRVDVGIDPHAHLVECPSGPPAIE